MKLRLRGESLRFRLTKTEVLSLHEQGWWQDAATLGPEGSPRFVYRVEVGADEVSTVRFVPGAETVITVVLPATQIETWANGNTVGLYFETPWGVKVAVEKDFRCLDEEREEDETDNFDNPNAGASHQGACDVD